MTKFEKRFWSKVDKQDSHECWNWKGSKNSKNYGTFWDNANVLAHRISWELHSKQKVPTGMQILHMCNNPSCVNPMHLYCGTHTDNVKDAVNAKRYNNSRGRLLSDCIINIRKFTTAGFSQRDVAKMVGVGKTTVSRIIKTNKYLCLEGSYV